MSAPLARRELRARPGRFGWLVVAVTVAVGFTVGAFGFSSQLTKLLSPGDATAALDALPEGSVVLTVESESVTSATALDDRLLAQVRAIDGVALAEGSYDQPVAFRLPAGSQPERPVILRGVVLSATWQPARWELGAGRAPIGPDEVAADAAALTVGQTSLGASAPMDLPTGRRIMRVVGIARPVGATAPIGRATPDRDVALVALGEAHVIFDPATAPALLDAEGRVDRIIALPNPGLSPDELERRLRGAMPPGVRVSASFTRAATTQHTVERLDDGVRSAV